MKTKYGSDKGVVLPLSWKKNYPNSKWWQDLLAGLTVGVMLIPQGMAYAMLVGVSPIHGLYASFLPPLFYALFGQSQKVSVGPVAIDSLVIAAGLASLTFVTEGNYAAMVFSVIFVVGILQWLFAFFKLGKLARFLSKPVIGGFTSASAIVIATSQLKHILSIEVIRGAWIKTLIDIINQYHLFNYTALSLAIATGLVIVFLKKVNKLIPAALIVVVGGILANQIGQLNLSAVGVIPSGFPKLTIMDWQWEHMLQLLPLALGLAIIGFVEVVSVDKALEPEETRTNQNANLFALGGSNLLSALFGGVPVTGGFGRSAVNKTAGAQTLVSGFYASAVIGMVLLFFTEWLIHLPYATLAAIIIVAVWKLIDFRLPRKLWQWQKQDFYAWLGTFLVTLLVNVQFGLFFGVLLSFLTLAIQTATPHLAVLGKIDRWHIYRNVDRFEEAQPLPKTLMMRIDANLFFGNIQYVLDYTEYHLNKNKDHYQYLVWDMSGVSRIDQTAIDRLKLALQQYQQKNYKVIFAQCIGPVRDLLNEEGLDKILSENAMQPTLRDADRYIHKDLEKNKI